jgi:hypothetical protein
MHRSAPWKTEETIIGWPRLLVLSAFSRFGGFHLHLSHALESLLDLEPFLAHLTAELLTGSKLYGAGARFHELRLEVRIRELRTMMVELWAKIQ